jgi:hypothetical protein
MPGTLIPLLAATAKAAGRTFRLLPSNTNTLPRWHGCCAAALAWAALDNHGDNRYLL